MKISKFCSISPFLRGFCIFYLWGSHLAERYLSTSSVEKNTLCVEMNLASFLMRSFQFSSMKKNERLCGGHSASFSLFRAASTYRSKKICNPQFSYALTQWVFSLNLSGYNKNTLILQGFNLTKRRWMDEGTEPCFIRRRIANTVCL